MLSAGMGNTKSKSTPIDKNAMMVGDVNDIDIYSQVKTNGDDEEEELVEDGLDGTAMSMIGIAAAEAIHSTPSQESVWEQALNDASEFENILFSIRRPSARHRLEKLVGALKILGSKLKRHEEVTTVLNERATTGSDGTGIGGSSSRKRALSALLGIDLATDESKKPTAQTQSQSVLVQESVACTDSSKSREPPLLKPKDKFVVHLLDDGELRCPNFSQNSICPLGSDCNRVHVFNPLMQPIPITHPDYRPKLYNKTDLEKVYLKYRGTALSADNFAEKIKPDSNAKQQYTSRFTCPVEKTIYYTHAIPSLCIQSVKSSQGIYWFESAKDSQASLCTLIIYSLQQRKIVPDTFLSSVAPTVKIKSSSSNERTAHTTRIPQEASVSLPLIHPWNWMEINYEDRCTRFSSQGCSEGKTCRFAHVHFPQSVTQDRAPNHKALPTAYLRNFGLTLSDTLWDDGSSPWMAPKETRPMSYFRIRYASDDRKRTWYTAAWYCPREGTIYYAAGAKNGLVNNQNMFLYPTLEDAKLAVCGVILNAFANRGLYGSWDDPSSGRFAQGDSIRETIHRIAQPKSQQLQKRPKLSNEASRDNGKKTKAAQATKKVAQKGEKGEILKGQINNQNTAKAAERPKDEVNSKLNTSQQQIFSTDNGDYQYKEINQDDEEGEIQEDLMKGNRIQDVEKDTNGEILDELFC